MPRPGRPSERNDMVILNLLDNGYDGVNCPTMRAEFLNIVNILTRIDPRIPACTPSDTPFPRAHVKLTMFDA